MPREVPAARGGDARGSCSDPQPSWGPCTALIAVRVCLYCLLEMPTFPAKGFWKQTVPFPIRKAVSSNGPRPQTQTPLPNLRSSGGAGERGARASPCAAHVTKRFHCKFRGCEFDKLSHIFK